MNPRWLIWKRVTNETQGFEFIIWIQAQARAYLYETSQKHIVDHIGFDRWLCAKYDLSYDDITKEAAQ